PGTPTGRAARLKPGRLWVRIPPWVVRAFAVNRWDSRLGRQSADHSRSEREMLRVRLPPEPLQSAHQLPSRSSPECSPPCQGGDRGFKAHRGRCFPSAGTVRKPTKRPSSSLGDLWVRLPLVPYLGLTRVVFLTAVRKTVAIML